MATARTASPAAKLRDRVLRLSTPNLVGEDVHELQRRLKTTTDGSFGPKTVAVLLATT